MFTENRSPCISFCVIFYSLQTMLIFSSSSITGQGLIENSLRRQMPNLFFSLLFLPQVMLPSPGLPNVIVFIKFYPSRESCRIEKRMSYLFDIYYSHIHIQITI